MYMLQVEGPRKLVLFKSHGIPEDVIDNTVQAAKSFFALPESSKMELDIHKTPNFKGYTALLGENTDSNGLGDLHEGFDIGWEPQATDQSSSSLGPAKVSAMEGANVWPSDLTGFKETTLEYYHRVLDVGKLLFPLFALALDLPENFFDDKTTKPAAIMRLLHYPPQSPTSFETDPDGRQIGIGAHTEYDPRLINLHCFTILWQDRAGGLQVQNTAGKWVDAVPIPGTLVVNLGDQFARWTNDVFKSTLHRVINRSGVERYSIPLFFGTNYDVLLEPIHTCVSPGSPSKYEIVTAGEYVKSRLEATYAHSQSAT
ncbi:2-oxoglutarate-Fe(II) type oxidoreductase hxnY [Psilocybe cubensis]|uniref:2-oxoglutarate-Fe(II) type oxidoreductase hxnY n=2 Tax=Psilocybe cubensis TaxID=181762 RepID=A0ACB8GYE6_PSICU|nr:2-oxoglutarate-Fe(II) type oxidoreductase hxnY [Psilocybe cubensis]KAH9480251.1 2-oxoglutarate-Fe(II) type oxidoreductase hxnY [Psilocybe cubensis]